MFKKLKETFIQTSLSDAEKDRIKLALKKINSTGYDNWGVSPAALQAAVSSVAWFYRKYFRVETSGLENIPEGRCLIIGNHGGQIPIDAMMVTAALLLEGNPPRLARGMVERWAPSLPWISTFFARCGQITGDVKNCRDLLENDECVMVFPEGVGGSGKTIFQRYELQRFGTGFVRLALETKSPIIPTAVIGMEESLPSISNLKPIAKSLGVPYIPIIPTGPIPLPTKVTIRFGTPLILTGDPDAPDSEIERLVEQVKNALRLEIEAGLKIRGEKIFTGAAK